MINKIEIKKWVEALRSEKFKKITGRLFGMGFGECCALGVFYKIHGIEDFVGYYNLNPINSFQFVSNRTGITKLEIQEIAIKNDTTQSTFNEIADYIENKYLGEQKMDCQSVQQSFDIWKKHFDPSNKKHIRAYKTLNETGIWSLEFRRQMIDKGCTFTPNTAWQIGTIILDYFIAQQLGE